MAEHVLRPRASAHCLLIPVLDEGPRILAQLDRLAALDLGVDVVVVDGGSTDGTADPAVHDARGVRALLRHEGPGRLSGQLQTGMRWALAQGYEGVVTVDGNGKDDVAAVPRFTAALAQGWDFVQGSRFVPGGSAVRTPTSRLLAIRGLHAPITSVAARHRFTDSTNGFRGHSARLLRDPRVDPFREVLSGYALLAYLPVRAARLGFRCTEVPVTRAYPEGAVPTKIHGMTGHAGLLRVLLEAAAGRYDP